MVQGIDLSDSGIAFESESELDFSSVLHLQYREEDGTEHRRTARLLYRLQRRYGAFFLEAGPANSGPVTE
jgi:hypothetical protein